MKAIHVDTAGNLLSGEAAEKALSHCSDSEYQQPLGVLKVPRGRWENAQRYEARAQRTLDGNDRNDTHKENFDQYKALDNLPVATYLEIGCGPFTNSRFILPLLPQALQVDLLDPLIGEHLRHAHCAYADKTLCGRKVVCHSRTAEEMEFKDGSYDMVVMINVLEHCFDADAVMSNIHRVLRPGGTFVFGEAAVAQGYAAEITKRLYDAGHPLRTSEEYIREALSTYAPLYHKTLSGEYDQEWRKDIYFIGEKVECRS